MKKSKRAVTLLAAIMILSAGSITSMAANNKSPADVVAGITGKPVEDVIQERYDTGKTYGAIAAEAGKLEEFKEESLTIKEEILSESVTDGFLTQEEADDILAAIQARQASCDGTGYGNGRGCGFGQGLGGGRGFRGGSCIYYN